MSTWTRAAHNILRDARPYRMGSTEDVLEKVLAERDTLLSLLSRFITDPQFPAAMMTLGRSDPSLAKAMRKYRAEGNELIRRITP